jgi:altronate dehydratase small subunit
MRISYDGARKATPLWENSKKRCKMGSGEALKLSEKDNVATSLADLEPGAEVRVRWGKEVTRIKSLEKIPFGFKIALANLRKGSNVIKYGETIGLASQSIKQGQLVHIHNIEGARARGDLV